MPDPIKEVLTRGVARIYPNRKALEKELKKRKIAVYWGADPTAPDLHLSHLENLLILKRFQDLGHKVIFLIGDATAQIGDPSDRAAARRKLSKAAVLKNTRDYKKQVSKVIRFSGKNPARIAFNSQWWEKLTYIEAMRKVGYHFTSLQLLKRDMFRKRIKAGNPPTVPEFLYPMMQAYDSVVLKVDAELGGTDQIFNMLAGRDLVKKLLGKEKFVIAKKLLADPRTGEILMSQSHGRYIAIDEPPNEMFGKIMALPDEVLPDCFELWTQIPMPKVKKILAKSAPGGPMEAKKRLAREVVALLYSERKAANAQRTFERTIQEKKPPKVTLERDYPDRFISRYGSLPTVSAITTASGLVSSMSEARRIIQQGGVEIDGERIWDPQKRMNIMAEDKIIKVGKRGYRKLKKPTRKRKK